MHHLAPLIRKGLDTPGITETKLINGIVRHATDESGTYRAGAVGLALIGAIGKEPAAELFRKAHPELCRSDVNGPATQAICKALGITVEDMNALNMRHHMPGYSAKKIADGLDAEVAAAAPASSD